VFTVKSFALVAEFPATVTVIFPVVAPTGTVVVIIVAVLAVTLAVIPLNITILFAAVVLKFVPVMMTDAPIMPKVGLKEIIVGNAAAVTVKLVALVAVLPAMVTVIVPVVAPAGTVVVILVTVLAVTIAVVPLNFTVLLAGVVLKFVPMIFTDVPTGPEVGVKDAMVGNTAAPIVKSLSLATVRQFAVIEIFPVVVPAGTVTVRLVAVLAVMVAVLLLKNRTTFSAGTGLKLVPVIITVAPIGPTVGVKPVIVAAPTKTGLFLRIDIEALPEFVTAKSALPSPSKSPIEEEPGFIPVIKSTLAA